MLSSTWSEGQIVVRAVEVAQTPALHAAILECVDVVGLDPTFAEVPESTVGELEEGKERLRSIYGRLVANGQCRSWFGKLSAFDAIRGDADMVELVDEWERAERVGAPTASANPQVMR